jgi:endonuclease-3
MRNVSGIIGLLEGRYGRESWNWHTRQNPFQVLISTVLSQRTRDENTDSAAKNLFARYPSPEMLARAPLRDIEKRIRPANYYRTKSREVREISRIIAKRYSGKTPKTMGELMGLPGVGKKTASCTLLYGHRISMIPCDVHVMVISQRLGWTDKDRPDEIQEDLEGKLPRRYWHKINQLFVKHGQTTCLTRNPKCGACPISRHCRYFQDTNQVRK